MAAPKERYPTIPVLNRMSLQEMYDRKLVGMNLANAGQIR